MPADSSALLGVVEYRNDPIHSRKGTDAITRHLLPGKQPAAAQKLDQEVLSELVRDQDGENTPEPQPVIEVGKMLAEGDDEPLKKGDFEREPRRTRTSNRLIKSDDPLMIGEAGEGNLASSGKVMNLAHYLIYYVVPSGIVNFVGTMLAKILQLIESVNRRNTEIQ